jgi:hypothetical protein
MLPLKLKSLHIHVFTDQPEDEQIPSETIGSINILIFVIQECGTTHGADFDVLKPESVEICPDPVPMQLRPCLTACSTTEARHVGTRLSASGGTPCL